MVQPASANAPAKSNAAGGPNRDIRTLSSLCFYWDHQMRPAPAANGLRRDQSRSLDASLFARERAHSAMRERGRLGSRVSYSAGGKRAFDTRVPQALRGLPSMHVRRRAPFGNGECGSGVDARRQHCGVHGKPRRARRSLAPRFGSTPHTNVNLSAPSLHDVLERRVFAEHHLAHRGAKDEQSMQSRRARIEESAG